MNAEMSNPASIRLIRRYRSNYGISPDSAITEEMILRHWELEKSLRKELLESNANERCDVFAACYGRLYSELEWLNRLTESENKESPATRYATWLSVIGQPPQRVYEIGSGKGELIYYLAQWGFDCKATEITRERGARWIPALANLSWGNSDGVHLERFEPANHYDVVFTDQVIEHLHPDDLAGHFQGVAAILKPGGRYILSTPHVSIGPADVSRVFRLAKPAGMHLKEYDYRELSALLQQSGFGVVKSVIRLPDKIRRLIGRQMHPRVSSGYLPYLCAVEKLIARAPHHRVRRKIAQLARLVFFAPEIFLVAEKS
jgi:SAM-dependent methyltransferase